LKKSRPRLNVLIQAYQEDRLDPNEQRELHGMLYAIVSSLLKTISAPNTVLCSYDDLVSEGMLRALESARTYDEERATFLAYSYNSKRGAMDDYIRRQDPLSRSLRQAYAELEDFVMSRESVTDEEILENTSLNAPMLARLRRRWDYRFPLSLDAEVGVQKHYGYGEPRDTTFHEIIGAEDMALQAIASQNGVMYAISRLPTERERDILIRYHVKEQILKEIGLAYDLSEQRICQIRKESEKTLRRTIKE
jgi:RNA polymerase sigma factor (sigma-70 family)